MRFIGITGGVGAGKSAILAHLASKPGIRVMLADEIAHDLMQPGTECFQKLKEKFAGERSHRLIVGIAELLRRFSCTKLCSMLAMGECISLIRRRIRVTITVSNYAHCITQEVCMSSGRSWPLPGAEELPGRAPLI